MFDHQNQLKVLLYVFFSRTLIVLFSGPCGEGGKKRREMYFYFKLNEVSTHFTIFACSEIQVVINISLISKAPITTINTTDEGTRQLHLNWDNSMPPKYQISYSQMSVQIT